MTTALATLLICIAGAALLLAAVTYYWVNRRPPANERFDEYGRVPLFGVDIGRTTPVNSAVVVGASLSPSAVTSAPVAATSASSTVVERSARPSTIDTSPSAPARQAGWGERPGWPVEQNGPTSRSAITEIVTGSAPFSRPVQTPAASAPVAPTGSVTPATVNPAAPAPAMNGNAVFANGVPGSMVEGHSVRFSVPAEGTLQFLPGRLEITSGVDAGREIRFVRVPGPNGTEVTFGRNEGPLYRHIQLRDQTVSREHARMNLVDGQWSLANLSRTNPVAHNGRVLEFGEHQSLADGDRVEMGEVVFNFRSR